MSFLNHFRPPHRPGLRYSEEARGWASVHFSEPHRQIAALVAGILCEQTGAQFSELHAGTHFINDVGVFDHFDAVDYSAEVQSEFGLVIPEADLKRMERISDLVSYLKTHTD